MSYNVEAIRAQFPSLKLQVAGRPAAFLDAPGGTQTPQRVIDRMVRYLVEENANTGGFFVTSEANDAMLARAREAFADFFHCDSDEVSFCHNSTTISFKLAFALARDMKPGDEFLLTDIDHEANRGPWEVLEERGFVIKSVRFDPDTCMLDWKDFEAKLTARTKVVAFNMASNAVGTISNAKEIVRRAHAVGAVTIGDAVHFALHGVMDMRALGADFVFCSAYKFFGPHVGVLYAKRERMAALRTLRVGAQKPYGPDRFETGTLNHEGIAGAAEAVEFLADVGKRFGDGPAPAGATRRQNVVRGIEAIEHYEIPISEAFKDSLRAIPGVRVYSPPKGTPCTSTVSLTIESVTPQEAARALAREGIFVWAGNFYAVQLVKALGLSERGGLLRFGLAPYNTKEEMDRSLEIIERLAVGKAAAV